MKTITSILVTEELRPFFLPVHFGRWMIEAESIAHGLLIDNCEDYQSAPWHYYELSNGGFYMAPDLQHSLTLAIPDNYFEKLNYVFHGRVSADVAGVIVTLFTLGYISSVNQEEKLMTSFQLLLDYTQHHKQMRSIFIPFSDQRNEDKHNG
jgi:hypothetical protein